jgi:hypothetical protein
MTNIVRSGAFLQQCWSVHPLCVAVKRMGDDRTMVLTCSSCRSAHHLAIAMVVPKDPAGQGTATAGVVGENESAEALLSACVMTHRASLTLREMDVFQDVVVLRCADCRRHYALHVSGFVTHHKH